MVIDLIFTNIARKLFRRVYEAIRIYRRRDYSDGRKEEVKKREG